MTPSRTLPLVLLALACRNNADDSAVDFDTGPACTLQTFYGDGDGDGFGRAEITTRACEQPDGFAAESGDCDDAAAQVFPGASEEDCDDPVDRNCDGSVGYADADGDGTAACEDCDDADASAHPGGIELCDGADNDCDGSIDNDAVDIGTWYSDADHDGFGAGSFTECDQPPDTSTVGGDCDDADSTAYPLAPELCDGVDNNCDGRIDEAAGDELTWYADTDGDGHGGSITVTACAQPAGFVADGDDCDDTSAASYPGATEVCDGLDNDCDGDADEAGATGEQTWYVDGDGDGYAGSDSTVFGCDGGAGSELVPTDCDDDDEDISPGADEVCDDGGVDENCNGLVDEQDPLVQGTTTYFVDDDEDGWGSSATVDACDLPNRAAEQEGDCDDGDPAINPGETEVCNGGIDDDCDSNTVEGSCAKVVFVTANQWTGALGGLDGGDAKCQQSAEDAGLPGTFKAFLADGSEGPMTRFVHSTTPYVRVDGAQVAANWTAMTLTGIEVEINVTEYGTPPPAAYFCAAGEPMAWSNASGNGAPRNGGNHCSDWTSTVGQGFVGSVNGIGNWSGSCMGSICDRLASLYCFEQ